MRNRSDFAAADVRRLHLIAVDGPRKMEPPHVGCYIGRENSTYASPLVLRRPVMRSPGFHWPRFFRSSRRSKRLSTFRLPPRVAAARRLRCCDIMQIRCRLLVFTPAPEMKRALYLAWFWANAKCFLSVKILKRCSVKTEKLASRDRRASWTGERFYGKMDCFLKNIGFNQRPIAA